MIENKPAYSVYKTKSFEQFKLLACNRYVDETHVVRLINEIIRRNMLPDFPILVNAGYEVLDGQHRLEAAKRLGLEVYFIITRNVDQESIAKINSTQKPWQLIDYVEWYATKGHQDYVTVIEFINRHMVECGVALQLLIGHTKDGGNGGLSNKVKNGTFKIHSIAEAEVSIKMAKDFIPHFSFAESNAFIKSVIKVSQLAGYNHETMMGKVSGQSTKLVKCPDIKSYMKLLVEIYNYKNSLNKLYL